MKKKDLRSGMVVETREGEKGLILLNSPQGDVIGGCGSTLNIWESLKNYNDYLKHDLFSGEDIMKIYTVEDNYNLGNLDIESNLIWERKENNVELTLQEIADKFDIAVENLRIKGLDNE